MRKLALIAFSAAALAAAPASADPLKISMEKVAALYTALTSTFGPQQMSSATLKLDGKTAFAFFTEEDWTKVAKALGYKLRAEIAREERLAALAVAS